MMKIFRIITLSLFLIFSNLLNGQDNNALRDVVKKKFFKNLENLVNYSLYCYELNSAVEKEMTTLPQIPSFYSTTNSIKAILIENERILKGELKIPNKIVLESFNEPDFSNLFDNDLKITRSKLSQNNQYISEYFEQLSKYQEIENSLNEINKTYKDIKLKLVKVRERLEEIHKKLANPFYSDPVGLAILDIEGLPFNNLSTTIKDKTKEIKLLRLSSLNIFKDFLNHQLVALTLDEKNLEAKIIEINERIDIERNNIGNAHKLLNNKREPINQEEYNLIEKWKRLSKTEKDINNEVFRYNKNIKQLKQDKNKLSNYTYGKCSTSDNRNDNKKDCCPKGNNLNGCNSKAHRVNRNNYYRNKKNLENSINSNEQKLVKENIIIQQLQLKQERDKNIFQKKFDLFKTKRDVWLNKYAQFKEFRKNSEMIIVDLEKQINTYENLLAKNSIDLQNIKNLKIE